MKSLFICCFFFVGLSVLQCAEIPSAQSSDEPTHDQSPEEPNYDQPPDEHSLKLFIASPDDGLDYMLDVNDDIQDFLGSVGNKFKFSMEDITILGKSINFLRLDDNEMLQLKPLHSYLMYTNGVCDDLEDQMSRLADGRYDDYLAGITYKLSADQTSRLGSPSRLEWAVTLTDETIPKIRSIFKKKETRTAMEMAQLKKLKISTEIIKLASAVKEIEMGIEPLSNLPKVKSDFLKNIQEMASDLEKHVQEFLKLDELADATNKYLDSIAIAQKGLSNEVFLSFMV